MKLKLSSEKTVEAEVVGFIPMTEPWAEYHLDNGAVLRFRGTAYRVLRVVGEKNSDGEDIYVVQSVQNFVVNEREEQDGGRKG